MKADGRVTAGQSREQIKVQMPERWATLAAKSGARVDALLHSIAIAQLSTDIDRDSMRDVVIAEYESFKYHQARAKGKDHKDALEYSRKGRREVDSLF
jgi:hypothetical protein